MLTGKYQCREIDPPDGSYWVPPRSDTLFDQLETYQQIVERSVLIMTEYSIAW